MPRELADVLVDIHDVAGMLHHSLTPASTEAEIRHLLDSLVNAADAAVFAALERGDHRATHHAMACSKELAVIAVRLAHAVDRP